MKIAKNCLALAILFVASPATVSAFIPQSLSSTQQQHFARVSLQESGRPQWDGVADNDVSSSTPSSSSSSSSSPSSSSFATESAGEATMRLGLNSAPTVWTEFGRLGQENEVVNLGQGFPDWLPPEFAVEALVEAAQDTANSPHQYTRPAGHPKLVHQLAQRYSIHMSRDIEPMTEVAVTVGASQALYLCLQTLIKPG